MNINILNRVKNEYKRVMLRIAKELTYLSYNSINTINFVFYDIKTFLNLGGFIVWVLLKIL